MQQNHTGPQRSPPTGSQQQPPRGGGSRNNLAVSPLPQAAGRVPGPQELAIHTQQIMQSALIKRKLKEQEESLLRKRVVEASKDPTNPSPTSLAFAPTVVMKKLAAERRDSDPKLQVGDKPVPAGPLVAAPGPHGDGGNDSSGRISPARLMEHIRTAQAAQQQHMPPPPPLMGPPMGPGPIAMLQQRALFEQSQQMKMIQQQQMAMAAMQAVDPRFMRPRHPSGGHPMGWGSRGPSPVMMSSGPMPPHHLPAPPPHGMGGAGLARFFSPEVLAQANAGNAPTMPPLPTQKVLTLEEIERQAATVRI